MQGRATWRQVIAGVLAQRGVYAGTDAGRTRTTDGRRPIIRTRNRTAPFRVSRKMATLRLNIVLDVVQRREPHYRLSAAALNTVVRGDAQGVFPAHGVTRVHYLVSCYADKKRADELVDWLCTRFEIGTAGRSAFMRARGLPFKVWGRMTEPRNYGPS